MTLAGPTIWEVFAKRGSRQAGYLTQRYGQLGLAVFSVFLIVGLVTRLPGHVAFPILGMVIALGAGIPLFLVRPSMPLLYASVATVGVVLVNAVPSDVGWFAVAVLGAWCVLAGGVRVGLVYWAASLLLFGGEWIFAVRDPGWADWAAGVTFSVLAALLVRHELVLVDQLRTAQAGLAERSRAEERNRIAREVHDVIAHSLTVSLLHISSARLSVEHDPVDAARALAEAERLSRQSLAEVRTTMGMLRSPSPSEAPAAPAHGVADLGQLVEQLRDAGADVSLIVDGDAAGIGSGIPATTGFAIYRIVQEALTNATRHAPDSVVVVHATRRPGAVEIEVDSAGVPRQGRGGVGLAGMRERAQAVGGTCTAGPGGHGWLVRATIPVADGPGGSGPGGSGPGGSGPGGSGPGSGGA